MATLLARIPSIVASYLSDEPSPQKVEQETREHFSNVIESHRARARGEPEMAFIYFRRELVNSANVYRMTDELLINHISVYFTLRDINAARITCSRWYGLITKNIVWHCQIPRYIPLVVMPPPAYLLDKTLGACNQVKLIFLVRRIACLQEAGVTIGGVNTYRDLAREVDAKKDLLAKHLHIFAREGQLDLVRIILQSSAVDLEDRGIAVCNAAEKGHLHIVQELLKHGAVISQENYGRAVCNAAGQGHLLIVQELLKDGAVISQEHRGWAVVNAAESGHLHIVQELLKDGAVISQEERGYALINAALNGHLLIVQELLIGGEISPEHRQQAIHATTNQDIINLINQV
jgi:hypothetical protein